MAPRKRQRPSAAPSKQAAVRAAFDALWTRAMADPSTFMFGDQLQAGMVFTQDEHDQVHPIKPLPDRRHLRLMNDLWDLSEPLIIPKSRQLLVSWFCMSRVTFELLHPGRRWLVFCRTFDPADILLERAWGIIERLPVPKKVSTDGKKVTLFNDITLTRAQGLIQAKHGTVKSSAKAAAEDSDAARSQTFSGVVIDEAAFTDNLAKLYAATKPTVMAGGKLVMPSSPNGRGTFWKLLSDDERVAL